MTHRGAVPTVEVKHKEMMDISHFVKKVLTVVANAFRNGGIDGGISIEVTAIKCSIWYLVYLGSASSLVASVSLSVSAGSMNFLGMYI